LRSPKEISNLYEEIYIVVEKETKKNLNFIDRFDYLAKNHYAPPNSELWIDRIRQKGNKANHEIKIMSKNDALEIINFLEMLLKFIYEFPGKVDLNKCLCGISGGAGGAGSEVNIRIFFEKASDFIQEIQPRKKTASRRFFSGCTKLSQSRVPLLFY